MATQFIESLKRLYGAKKITLEYLQGLVKQGKITEDDLIYVVGYLVEEEEAEEKTTSTKKKS